jgi:hypothetical protein
MQTTETAKMLGPTVPLPLLGRADEMIERPPVSVDGLESHRKRLREAFGNTMSDEFVDLFLGKLVEALRPGLYDTLEEATLNAALATIQD